MWQEDRYREVLAIPGNNPILMSIWRDAYGDDYPAEADPFGFVTITDLDSIRAELRLTPDSKLLDLGCGRGGPGLWVARAAGCALTGLDILAEALAHADALTERMGMSNRAKFAVGTFAQTGLPASSQCAVMSVDAFWMVLDKTAALSEIGRILRPEGRLAMTTWVKSQAELEVMMNTGGLRCISCTETPQGRQRQMAVYRGILRNRQELTHQLGEGAAAILIAEATEAPSRLAREPRCLVVAERRT